MSQHSVYTSRELTDSTEEKMYALIVCDNADETALLSLVLQRVGLAVTYTDALDRALRSWPQRPADIVVLALREGAAPAQVHQLRTETEVPVALIANEVDEDVLYDSFEAGADLIVVRPYSARLLIAQLRSLLRRSSGTPLLNLPLLEIGGLSLDPSSRDVQVEGHSPRRLTHLEFRLLYTLMIHQGQTLPTDTIVERVWGYSGEGDRDLVRGLISRLRSKVEADPKNPKYILNVPGVGYRFHNPQG